MSVISIQIQVKPAQLAEILTHPDHLIPHLTDQQKKQLQENVYDQLQDKDGAPQIQDLQVPFFEINQNYSHGRFRIKFNIGRQFCCSDSSSCTADYVDFNFGYAKGILHATGNFMSWDMDN